MGFARDLGAAMTFGMSVSTKHKEQRPSTETSGSNTSGA